MSETGLARLHAVVEGHVQGVGFRAFVQREALQLNVVGWVRNRWSGEVEVLAEGKRQELSHLLNRLYQGPRSGFVTHINFEWQDASGEFKDFRVKSTV